MSQAKEDGKSEIDKQKWTRGLGKRREKPVKGGFNSIRRWVLKNKMVSQYWIHRRREMHVCSTHFHWGWTDIIVITWHQMSHFFWLAGPVHHPKKNETFGHVTQLKIIHWYHKTITIIVQAIFIEWESPTSILSTIYFLSTLSYDDLSQDMLSKTH